MPPKMLTIRQVAGTGVLSEHALRLMQRQGRLPCLYVGNRCLVNYDKLLAQLDNLGYCTSAENERMMNEHDNRNCR